MKRALLPTAVAAGLLLGAGLAGTAVDGGFGESPAGRTAPSGDLSSVPAQWDNVEYDGRFTFARISFETGGSGLRGFGRRGSRGEPPWAHDFPRAERNFMQIITETTLIRPYMQGGNVFTTDDPELTKYPLAYVSEPGFWYPSDDEIEGFRNYIMKGGFVIFDDFRGGDLYNLQEQMGRVLPGARWVQLDATAEIFDSFFRIEDLTSLVPYGRAPLYLGIYEDNDPAKRLMVIANYNNDIGEFWEFSDTGWYPIDLSNDAYKLGVNYLIYAMTH